MEKVSLFFIVLFFLSVLTACGQTGTLYYPKPQKHSPSTSTSVKKSEVVI